MGNERRFDVEHIFDTGPHDLPDAKILERARLIDRAHLPVIALRRAA